MFLGSQKHPFCTESQYGESVSVFFDNFREAIRITIVVLDTFFQGRCCQPKAEAVITS